MAERKLATVRMISGIFPIEGADKIEVAVVDGWKVVINRNIYKVGDLVVYCEIDSWIPNSLAPFLSKGQEPREYNGVKGERLRSVKLRGQISQGLILPFNTIMSHYDGECSSTDWNLGDDVTELLGIQKWERPIPVQLQGQIAGNFPTHLVPKTDQERIQNIVNEVAGRLSSHSGRVEVTEKLDGSSCTIICHNGEYRVCSRNLELKRDENNAFWIAALRHEKSLMEYHRMSCTNFAIQGELISSGIQGNPYKLPNGEVKLFVFDIYDIECQKYVHPSIRRQFCTTWNLDHVPVLCEELIRSDHDNLLDYLLQFADGKSQLNKDTIREGLVYKFDDGSYSFKVISNKWLVKNGE